MFKSGENYIVADSSDADCSVAMLEIADGEKYRVHFEGNTKLKRIGFSNHRATGNYIYNTNFYANEYTFIADGNYKYAYIECKTPSDANTAVTVNKISATDKSLSINGKSADAKVVGEKLLELFENAATYPNVGRTPSKNVPMLTFVTDDARETDYTFFRPIFAKYGIGCTTAVPTNTVGTGSPWITLEHLKSLQDDYGWEVCSHGHHSHLTQLTDDELDSELRNSQKWLIDNGFNAPDILMIPYGDYDERVKRHIAKYYKFARTTQYGLGTYPICQYEFHGQYMSNGTWVNAITGFANNTADNYKALIDYAITNNAWLIIWTHSWEIQNWNMGDVLDETLAYAKEKSDSGDIKLVSCKEALDLCENVVEQASRKNNINSTDYYEYDDHFVISGNGQVSSNIAKHRFAKPNAYSYATKPFEFPLDSVTSCVITSDVSNYPNKKSGILTTYCIAPTYKEPTNAGYV